MVYTLPDSEADRKKTDVGATVGMFNAELDLAQSSQGCRPGTFSNTGKQALYAVHIRHHDSRIPSIK